MKNNATTEIGKTIDNRYSMTFIVVASYTAVLFSPKNQKQTDHHTTTNTQESEYLTTRMRKWTGIIYTHHTIRFSYNTHFFPTIVISSKKRLQTAKKRHNSNKEQYIHMDKQDLNTWKQLLIILIIMLIPHRVKIQSVTIHWLEVASVMFCQLYSFQND